ncbi:MAG: glycine betaine ABC transporter substrate-binding protein [bacterium]
MSLQNKAIIIFISIISIVVFLLIASPYSRNGGLRAAFDAEFLSRPDGYTGLKKHYGLEFNQPPLQMDPGLMYRALASGAVDVIDAFATDGRIPAYGLKVLEDDKEFFPPYYAVPLIKEQTLKNYPDIREVLSLVTNQIDDSTMQHLNFLADRKGHKAENIARNFLLKRELIQPLNKEPRYENAVFTVGGKHFTEQEIIGQIIALLLERKMNIKVRRKLNLGGTMICFNALRSGDVDLYVEYTGTGLLNILNRENVRDADKTYSIVKKVFKEKYHLIWLDPLGFNNTYTLTMRKNHAQELGIETISDLSDYLVEQ